MRSLKQNNQFFLFNFEQDKTDQTQFLTPQFWQQQNRILGYAKGRGITWFIQSEDLFGVNTALRHYYRGGLWGKINSDLYYFTQAKQSRSFLEFKLLHELHQAGLPVPKPIAAKVEKYGLGYRADLLSEKIENAQDLTVFLQHQQITAEGWQQIGKLIRQLHNLQICHTDLNAHNILLQNPEQPKFWLIDFDKCGKRQGEDWKRQNLERLARSFHKEVKRLNIHFNSQNWQELLKGYAMQD